MHAVNRTKQLAVMAVMAAFSTVLTVLGTVISINTVFFTALAAYLAGIMLMRYGKAPGILFYVVCAMLDFFVNPDKLHVLLYLVLAGYIVFSEFIYCLLSISDNKKKGRIHLLLRIIIFVVLYVPLVWFLPQYFVNEKMLQHTWIFPVLLALGVVGWLLFDKAYCVFKRLFMQRFSKLF